MKALHGPNVAPRSQFVDPNQKMPQIKNDNVAETW